MLCASKALPRLIPELIMSAPRSSEVVIVSPWIQPLLLKPPVTGSNGNWHTKKEMSLQFFLRYVIEMLDLKLALVVRELDRGVERVTQDIVRRHPNSISISEEPFLHAKAVVTNTLVLQMSANLIPTSLYRNIENCNFMKNTYGNARKFARSQLKIRM
jgi:hypothetical protein